MLARAAFALLLVVSLPSPLRAQSTSASLTGRITDPSKALIADAKIAAINAGTSVRYEATSNSSGEYYLAYLPPGPYRIEVEKAGFKKLIKPDVTLRVQDVLAIDFDLAVGSVAETVTVEAGAPEVNTESASVSTVIDRTFVENIPLNGRSFQTLITLTPGVVLTPTAFDDQGQFSVNGQRTDANYFTVDGVSANFGVTGYLPLLQAAGGALPALSAQGGTNSLVSVEGMQEFRVQTSSFAPEFGRAPGGQISIVTRSGTNQFHGAVFEYFRNSVLDANDWFSNRNHLPKPEERQNDFGGVFGGPILKDKTFFFFSYEGLRLRQPAVQETAVPCDSSCSVFGNSRAMASPVMQPYLNAFPLPNGAENLATCTPGTSGCPASGKQPSGLAQFNGSYSNPSSLDAYSIRVDHAINSKLSLFGRYDYSPSNLSLRGPAFSGGAVLSTTQSISSSVQTFTLGATDLITLSISNEARANYSNDRVSARYGLDNFGGAVPLPDSAMYPSGFSSGNGLFQLVIVGAGEYANGPTGTDEQRQVNLADNLSWSRGSHQFKFGVDYRWLSPFSVPNVYAQFAEFGGVSASPKGALSGTTVFSDLNTNQGSAFLAHNYSFYGQDTWKLTPQLTLTYGLRWDINPALTGKNSANEPFTVTGLNDPATIALAPRGTPLYKTTYGNVAPRVGVAYQLRQATNWGTVLRSGFGIFYDLGYGSLGAASSFFPFGTVKFTAPSLCPSGATGICFPITPQQAAPPVLATTPPVVGIFVADPHLKLPRTYEWNVGVEQSLGSSQSLSLTYVGAAGRDLLRVTQLFKPNKNFVVVNETDNSAISDYQALQIKFQRRLSHDLQALASYTFSHSIDNASTDAAGAYFSTPSSIANPNIDRASSDFDIRHAFSAGVTYNLPSPASKKFARATLGGWSLDSFVFARSAPPVDVAGPISNAGGVTLKFRPNVVPGVPLVLYGSQYPGGKAFNKNAFTPAAAGHQGDFGRNVLRGFGAWQADFAVQRQFRLTENVGLRFRSEFFNIFNHPNFGPPDNTFTDALFGRSTQTLASSLGSGGTNGGFSPLYQIGGPRSIQFALKLQF